MVATLRVRINRRVMTKHPSLIHFKPRTYHNPENARTNLLIRSQKRDAHGDLSSVSPFPSCSCRHLPAVLVVSYWRCGFQIPNSKACKNQGVHHKRNDFPARRLKFSPHISASERKHAITGEHLGGSEMRPKQTRLPRKHQHSTTAVGFPSRLRSTSR